MREGAAEGRYASWLNRLVRTELYGSPMTWREPSPDALRHLLVTILVGALGETRSHWDTRLSDVLRLDLGGNPSANWTVRTVRGASVAERDALERAVELVKAEHPCVRW